MGALPQLPSPLYVFSQGWPSLLMSSLMMATIVPSTLLSLAKVEVLYSGGAREPPLGSAQWLATLSAHPETRRVIASQLSLCLCLSCA